MSYQPIWITDDAPPDAFPDIDTALIEPNGLLAIGGDLSPARLMHAYRRGIFPWYSDGQPILWWSPDPRVVMFPGCMHVSRSLRKIIRQRRFKVTSNRAFDDVMAGCAEPRPGQQGTWITGGMKRAYLALHQLGHAHSLECWREGRLAGGIYGVAIGRVFFGESMFSRESNASKVALAELCSMGFKLIDCQIPNPHLARLGAEMIPRRRFAELLQEWCDADAVMGPDRERTPE